MTRAWRIAGAVAALVLLAAGAGHAAPGPRRARDGTLAGLTRVTWSGVAGLRLRVPRQVLLPRDGGTRLFVRGGTYAFVRWFQAGECEPWPGFCDVDLLTYTPQDTTMSGLGPGLNHARAIDNPPEVHGTLEMYLFTDGEATLELRPPGLTGRTEYVATGRVTASVKELPATCVTACDRAGYGGTVRYGGLAGDTGTAGYAEVWAYNQDMAGYPGPAPGVPWMQPHPVRVCLYPNASNRGSPDPAAHPHGCDAVATRPYDQVENATRTWNAVAYGLGGHGGVQLLEAYPYARGRIYAGFQMAAALDRPRPQMRAWGIWVTFGIR